MSMYDAARPRGASTIEARIVSERTKPGGSYSCFARLKAANIAACANHIAANYAGREPDPDELMRAVQLYEKRYPQAAQTIGEVSSTIRTAKFVEQQRIPVRDINKQILDRMTAVERLDLVNTGSLSDRFILLGPNDADR